MIRTIVLAVFVLAPGSLLAQGAGAAPKIAATADIDPAVLDALRKSTAAQMEKKTFRAQMNASIGGNVMPSLEVEVIQPDRIRLKRSGMEIVSVGGKAMVRQGDKWSPAPEGVTKFIGAFGDPKSDERMLAQAVYAKHLGPSRIDNRVVTGYEIHSKGKEGLTKSKIFISTDDSLVRRVETKGEIKGREANFTAMVGDYGVPLAIELPK